MRPATRCKQPSNATNRVIQKMQIRSRFRAARALHLLVIMMIQSRSNAVQQLVVGLSSFAFACSAQTISSEDVASTESALVAPSAVAAAEPLANVPCFDQYHSDTNACFASQTTCTNYCSRKYPPSESCVILAHCDPATTPAICEAARIGCEARQQSSDACTSACTDGYATCDEDAKARYVNCLKDDVGHVEAVPEAGAP